MPVDSILIDKGSNNGVVLGAKVIIGDRILIGKVEKVFDNQSVVSLNSFARQTNYGYNARSGDFLEIQGIGGGNLQAKVPIDFDILVGDRVEIDGAKSYVFAVVNSIEEDKASGLKNILLTLPVNIAKQRFVSIEIQQ